MKYKNVTEEIIKIFFKVYNTLGYGFLENVYENAMKDEFEMCGILYENQKPIKVLYNDKIVGDYIADFVIENKIIVELKAVKELAKEHESQLINYLTATNKEVGLLLNFGKNAEIKRKVYDNDLKKYNPSVEKPCNP